MRLINHIGEDYDSITDYLLAGMIDVSSVCIMGLFFSMMLSVLFIYGFGMSMDGNVSAEMWEFCTVVMTCIVCFSRKD